VRHCRLKLVIYVISVSSTEKRLYCRT